jgi:hypothetical protein
MPVVLCLQYVTVMIPLLQNLSAEPTGFSVHEVGDTPSCFNYPCCRTAVRGYDCTCGDLSSAQHLNTSSTVTKAALLLSVAATRGEPFTSNRT